MKIREATLADVSEVSQLNAEVQSVHLNISPETFRKTSSAEVSHWFSSQIDDEKIQCLVAIEGIKVVGYINFKQFVLAENPFMHERKYGYIDHLCVSAKSRGKGIARQLVNKAIDYCKAQRVESIELTVWSENSEAKSAFHKMGFINCREQMRLALND